MDAALAPNFAINGVVADFAAETLRDHSGAPVPLRPQAFAVLRHLAANPNRLVTKDELMAAVWPGIAVTDDSLVQCIHDIRRAIGDDAHAVVTTVPRRGYRLVLPEPTPAPGRPARGVRVAAALSFGAVLAWLLDWPVRRWALVVGAALLVLGGALVWWSVDRVERTGPTLDAPPLLAVVPFVNVTGGREAEGLALGLRKDFYTDLASFRDFQIVLRSPNYPESYVENPPDADYVLGGSINSEAGRLRLTTHLFDAKGVLLWSDRLDRPDRDLFALQAEVSERVANRLGGSVGLIQELGRQAARRTRPDALGGYGLYLLATDKLLPGDRAGLAEAIALLGRALERDPDLARAWAELSLAHDTMAAFGIEPEANRRAAADAADRAVALDPTDARTHVAAAISLRRQGELLRAGSEFHTALYLAPNAAENLAAFAAWVPTIDAAMADQALLLQPDLPALATRQLAQAYFMAGRHEAALAVIASLPPEAYTGEIWAFRAGALAALGRTAEARRVAGLAAAARPDLSIEALLGDPSWNEAGQRRFLETLRPAGFTACATPEVLAGIAAPRRLPECDRRAAAAPLRAAVP